MADESKVVNYEGNKVSLFAPEQGYQRDIAYVRPGDEVELNFDIRDQQAIKVEVVKGDLHIIFQNGSTLTLASMAAIGFGANSPKLRTLDGKVLSLEEFLSVTEVLNYNEAILILANENQVEYSEDEPKVVQVSSDQDAENDAGIPITGQGNSDLISQGVPTEVIDPNGVVANISPSVSTGPFVSTIWTTNSPYNLDKTNYLPGDTTEKNLPSLEVKVIYGSLLNYTGSQQMGSVNYDTYTFKSGENQTDDPTAQLQPREVRQGSSTNNIFINNSSEDMSYIFNMKYNKGIFPSRIEIVVPKSVADIITLSDGNGLNFSGSSTDKDGNVVYSISNVNPLGIMEFLLSFPENTQITNFDLTYKIGYLDPSSGEFKEASTTTSLSLYPVTEEEHVIKSDGYVLSTHANPIDVVTGSGDDVIVGGGGNNKVISGAGNDRIFTYGGDDIIEAGEGDDEVWGSGGSDLIDGGEGNNKLYYDNNKEANIDPTGNSFKDSYYKTNKTSSGLFTYLGFEAKELKDFAGEGFKNSSKITDGSILVKKSQGADVVNRFQTIHLSGYNDTVTISDKINLGSIFIHGGILEDGKKDNDTIIIDDSFENVVVNFGENQSTVENADGALLTFTNFEQVKGSKNDDKFFGNIIGGFVESETAIAIDGGAGTDTLSYASLTGSIEFDANTGDVKKKDAAGEKKGVDKIRNIDIIEGSDDGADTFYGSFSNHYTYANLGANDIVSYDNANSGVTLVLDGSTTSYTIYKTSTYYKSTEIPENINEDILEGSLEGSLDLANLALSKRKDVIIVTDLAGSYEVEAGAGRDVLSYAELSDSIKVEFVGDTARVTKNVGGTDKPFNTFKILSSPNNVNIYQIIGTSKDDEFIMNESPDNKGGFSLDGGDGRNTLSYKNMPFAANGNGVSFILSSEATSRAQRDGLNIVDYFKKFQVFEGSRNNDFVIFDSIVTIEQINDGLEFDLGDGTDSVNYSQLNPSQARYIDITFSGGNDGSSIYMIVAYEGDQSKETTFENTEGVTGTAGDDIFHAVGGIDLIFDGFVGNDTADYSAIAQDLTFSMYEKSKPNVIKGSNSDKITNVEHIKGGSQNNLFYLDAGYSYTIEGNEDASKVNTVSYHYSTSGIVFDLETNKITKGSGDKQQTDTLLGKISSVKGSRNNDTFIVFDNRDPDNMNPSITSYKLYGNDVIEDASGNPTVTPTQDTDIIDFSKSVTALAINLDTRAAGSYNEYNGDTLIKEGFARIEHNSISFDLYHIEGITGTNENDTFTIMSSYMGAKGRSRWTIDGKGGDDDKVDYSQDDQVGVIKNPGQPDESWGDAIIVDLNSNGIQVQRNYSDATGALARASDKLNNIENLVLSNKDDTVQISTGWENSGIKTIDGGVRDTSPGSKAKGDTLSFNGISDEIAVNFNTDATFTAQIIGSGSVLPNFINFDNIILSKGKSTVFFKPDSVFDPNRKVTITASNDSLSVPVLDFTALTSAFTLTLAQNRDGTPDIFASSGAGGINGSIRLETLGSKYTVKLADFDNIIYASASKHMIFTGVDGGNNTLDYTNLVSVGIEIDYAKQQIIKGGVVASFDTFDNSFSVIKGTNKVGLSDTFLISDININLAGKSIDLGGQDGDKILIDIDNASYDIANTLLGNGGTTQVDISVVGGVKRVEFGGKSDKIEFKSDYENSGTKANYSLYDGGTGAENTLDFSGMSTIIFDARNPNSTDTARIAKNTAVTTDYSSIVWDKAGPGSTEELQFKNFYKIIGASSASMFYGQARGNFNFEGKSTNDTLNYSQSLSNISIYLLDNKIDKNEFADTFDGIETIIGSNKKDTFVIDQFKSFSSAVTVDGGTGENNVVSFNFDPSGADAATSVLMKFGQTAGDTSFTLKKPGQTDIEVDVNFENFQEYKLTKNNDRVERDSSLADNVRIEGGDGIDEIIYTGSTDIEFDSQTGILKRGSAVGSPQDTLSQMEIISYDGGTGKATFKGSMTNNYTYKGDSKRTTWDVVNYNDAVIDYSRSAPTSSITVDFTLTNNLMKITKDNGNLDFFDGYITKIIGTRGDDVFQLASRTNLPDIRLEGGGGTDRVSYANLGTAGYVFIVDNGDVIVDPSSGQAGFTGYKVDSTTITAFQLTKGNDTFQGGANTEIDVDGDDGIDTLDYSAINGVNITVDFIIGRIIKTTSSGAKVDSFKNFESVKTGNGDDTIIINDSIVSNGSSGEVDVGGGINTLDASKVTYNMTVDYGASGDYKSNISYNNGTPNEYSGFQEITLGSGSSIVNYTHSATYEGSALKFTSFTGSNAIFNFKNGTTGTKTFFVDATSNDVFNIRNNSSAANPFLVLSYFNEFSAKDTNNELHIEAAGLSGNKIFWGGTTANDAIDYTASVFSITASMKTENGQQYLEVIGKSNGDKFTDRIYNIENVILSNNNDIFEVEKLGNYTGTGNTVTVDGSGGRNEVSFARIDDGGKFDAGDGIIDIAGYSFKNFQTMSLTGGEDHVYFKEDGGATINANAGNDTAYYTGEDSSGANTPFTDGVSVSLAQFSDGVRYINVNKKATGDNDQLQNFEVFKLTEHDDEFSYSGTGDGFDETTFEMGAGRNTVDFSQLDASVVGTTFSFDGTYLKVENMATAGSEIRYKFKDMNDVIMGGTGSTFSLTNLAEIGGTEGFSINGGDPSLDTDIDLTSIGNASNMIVNLYDENVSDSVDANIGLSFKNFRSITGNNNVKSYLMTERNFDGEDVSYTITTGNDNAIISYKEGETLGGISVDFGSSTDTIISKSNGSTDTIKEGQFGELIGTDSDDTFTFSSIWKDGLTIDSAEGINDTLDFSNLNSETTNTITLKNANVSEVKSSDGSRTATFKNFTIIRGSNTQNTSFVIDLTAIATNYQNISFNGGTGVSNTFSVIGSGITSPGATLSVADNNTAIYDTSANGFNVGIGLTYIAKMDFSTVDMATNVEFKDYYSSSIKEIKVNASKINDLILSSKGAYVTVSGADFLLKDNLGGDKLTATGFSTLTLGSQQDFITISAVASLVIDSGSSTASNPDTLIVDNTSTDRAVVLEGKNIRVYGKNNPVATDAYTTAIGFPVINIESDAASLYITANASLTDIQKITHTKNSGALYLVENTDLIQGSFSGSAILDLSDFNNIQMKLSAVTSVKIQGFKDYYFGSGNNTVMINGANPSTIQYNVTAIGGDNTLNLTNWDFTTGQAYIEVNGDTTSYHRTASETIFSGEGFYNVDMSAIRTTPIGQPIATKVSVTSLSANEKYLFNQIELLEFDNSIKDAHIDQVLINDNVAIFSSDQTGVFINANWKDHTGTFAKTNPFIKINNTAALDYDFNVKVFKMADSVDLRPSSNIPTGFYAPNMATGYKSVLDFRSFDFPTETAGYYRVHMTSGMNFGAMPAGAISFHRGSSEALFYNFNTYYFNNTEHRFEYNGGTPATQVIGDWTLYAGGNNKDAVQGQSGLKLQNGHIILNQDSGGNILGKHTWYGAEIFSGFTTVFFNLSESKTRSMTYENPSERTNTSDVGFMRIAKTNYEIKSSSEENSENKSFADQITYTLTEGRDTLQISEVKNNTVFDTMEGKDDIIFSGNAAFYSVEHFKDEYITVGDKQFATGGSYLVITDNDGNKMYVLYADLEDILAGGLLKYDEEGNLVSSGYQFDKDNFNPNIPVENERESDSHNHDEETNSYYSDGSSDGATSFGRSFKPSSFSFKEDANDDDSSADLGEKPPFELVEDEGLELAFDDEVNLDENQKDLSENESADKEIVDEISDNENLDDLLDDAQDQQNQNMSDEELMDMLSQTFSKEDDSLDNIDISLELDSASIDMSSINENLVEETVLQESDIDSYKLESERNDDGTLKIHNQNGSNGNGGLGF